MIIRVQAAITAARVEDPCVQHATTVGSIIGKIRALSVEGASIALALNGTGRATPLDSIDLSKRLAFVLTRLFANILGDPELAADRSSILRGEGMSQDETQMGDPQAFDDHAGTLPQA